MTNEELVSLIDREITNSVGYFDSKLSVQRREAMDDYMGEPYGNEVEGRSQYVSRDVADTIEGIMPSLMRIFTATDDVCKFEPVGIEDIAGAEQATDAVNYVFWKKNNGFVVLYSFFKDALMQKNGFCKIYSEKYEKKRVEEYNLPPEQVQILLFHLQASGKEVVEVEETDYGVRLHFVDTETKICLDPIPPEEIKINKNASWDLQKCRFVAHERRITASEIREMGIEFDDEMEADSQDWNLERLARFQNDQSDSLDDDGGHEPNALYTVRECYMLVDWDGDGIAERRMVMQSGNKVLVRDGEEINYPVDRVPIVTATPILMPHKLFGISLHDLVEDLQLLKTTLIRSLLDNMYMGTHNRVMALDGMVNIDDLLTVRPGGIVRVKTFDAVKPMPVPFLGAPAFQMLGYIDQAREIRTGQRHFQGINPDSINKDISGVALDKFTVASMEKIELIARIFAETGVKEMMLTIFSEIQKNWKKEQYIRLRNDWVKIDPRQWAEQYDITVTVGLGTGNKAQFLQGAQMIGTIQKEIAMNGGMGRVVNEQNVYNYAKEVADAVTPRKGELFFTDPSKLGPPSPPPPDPKIEMQREKAVMADKTKRDMKAIDLLTTVAQLSKPDQSGGLEREKQESDQNFQREMRRGDQSFERENQSSQREHEADMKMSEQTFQMLNQTMADNMRALSDLQKQFQDSQKQMMDVIGQLAKIAGAERELVMDEKTGEPVRSRVVMQ